MTILGEGERITQCQERLAAAFGMSEFADRKIKDLSRVSFLPSKDYMLFVDNDRLFNHAMEERIEMKEEETKEELFSKCCERLELKTNDISRTLEVLNMMGFSKMEVKDDSINIYERLNEGGAITIALAKENIQTNEIAVKTDALEDYYFQLTGGNKNA